MYFNPRALPLYFAHISLMYGSYMRRKPQKRTLEVAVFDGEVPYISEKPPVKKQNLPYITQMRLTEVLCGMWMIRTLVRVPFFREQADTVRFKSCGDCLADSCDSRVLALFRAVRSELYVVRGGCAFPQI